MIKNKFWIIAISIITFMVFTFNVKAEVYTFDFRTMTDNFEDNDKLNALHDLIDDVGSDPDNAIIYGSPAVVYVVNNFQHIQYNTSDIQGKCGWIKSNGYIQYNYNSNTKEYVYTSQSANTKYSWIYQILYFSNDVLYDSSFLGND